MKWISVKDAVPTHGRPVMVLTPGGDIRTLVHQDGLWFLEDMSMYVYFTPTHWQELP